jgi:hypothetical protein
VENWREYAACREIGTAAFFEDGKGSGSSSESALAKAICAGCPVRRQCLSAAMYYERSHTASERAGIWGGLGPRQRHKLWKELQSRREVEVKPTCKRGHIIEGENVYVEPGNGSRRCRKCKHEGSRNWYQQKQMKAS